MTRSRLIPLLAVAVAVLAAAAADARAPVTASGWKVTPAGKQVRTRADSDGFQGPLASALSPRGSMLLSLSSGASRMNSADLFRLGRRARRVSFRRYDARRGRGVFYGATFSPDGRRAWASGGGQGVVHAYTIAGNRIKPAGEIPTPHFPAGLAYGRTPLGDRLYVANNLSGPAGTTNPPGRTVTVIDPATNGVTAVIDLGVALQPYGVAFERTGRKAYVTNWMGRSVTVIDTAKQAPIRQVLLSPVTNPLQADHPNAVAANPRRDEVYTSNGNSDTVSVIDTRRGDRLAATIDVGLTRGRLKGATPNALTASPDGRRLYVSLAGENAVAVVDVRRRRTIGFIPTAWHPVDVDVTPNGRRLVVTATNGADVRANRCAGPYAVGDCTSGDLIYGTAAQTTTATMTKGVVNLIRVPRTERGLAKLSERVRRNNRVRARRVRMPSYLRAIKHVIYVIKENRTYDQILGDVKGGRGDRTLTLFKNASAPNHRLLARRFTLFDNFYATADVSADGHSWSVSAGVSDYTSRTWPVTYSPSRRKRSRARDFENIPQVQQFMTEPLVFDPTVFRSAASLTHGYLWDNAYYNGVSFRNYGEFTKIPGDCTGDTNTSETTTLDDRRFGDHVDERFAGFNLYCSDHAHRIPAWEREFRAFEAQAAADPTRDPLPQLQFVRLPNDHTIGTRPGMPTPEAYMADNDLALGRLVEVVSKSRFWKDTAIFVTEDDAQNGPDHIDAHRTVSYVISPYTQRRRTDRTHYDTVSMVATIEDLLGLPPMTIVDQRAIRMWKAFNRKPNFAPYTARQPKVIPAGAPGVELNAPAAPLARASSSWNFDVEDATPEIPLNDAIWRSIKGRRSRMPAPKHDYIIGSRPVDAPE